MKEILFLLLIEMWKTKEWKQVIKECDEIEETLKWQALDLDAFYKT